MDILVRLAIWLVGEIVGRTLLAATATAPVEGPPPVVEPVEIVQEVSSEKVAETLAVVFPEDR